MFKWLTFMIVTPVVFFSYSNTRRNWKCLVFINPKFTEALMDAVYVELNLPARDSQTVRDMSVNLKSASVFAKRGQGKYAMPVSCWWSDGRNYQKGRVDTGTMWVLALDLFNQCVLSGEWESTNRRTQGRTNSFRTKAFKLCDLYLVKRVRVLSTIHFFLTGLSPVCTWICGVPEFCRPTIYFYIPLVVLVSIIIQSFLAMNSRNQGIIIESFFFFFLVKEH